MAFMPEDSVSEKPMAIVGDEDVVSGFRALGFKTYAIKEPKETGVVLDEVVQQKCAVCLVQDNIYLEAQNQISKYKNLPLPIFIPFARKVKADLLETLIKDMRLRATGTF